MALNEKLLGKRLIAATRLARWEAQLVAAVKVALDRQRTHALSVIAHAYGGTVTASVPPDAFDENTWADDMEGVSKAAQGIYADIGSTTAHQFLTQPGELPTVDLTSRLDRVVGQMQGLGPSTSTAIGDTLTQGVAAGDSIPKLADRVSSVFDSSTARATLIARTEVVGASNGLAHDYATAVNDSGVMPLQKTWLATADERTRPDHADADGQVVENLDDPFDVGGEELMYPGDENGSPENVCNCFPGDVVVSHPGTITGALRRWYEGPLLTLTLATGDVLTVTPKHPLLGIAGWRAAQTFHRGDDLLCAIPSQRSSLRDPDIEHVPASIREVFDALADSGIGPRVVRTDVDLHGDVPDSDVEVVRADGALRPDRKPYAFESDRHFALVTADANEAALMAPRSKRRTGRDALGWIGSSTSRDLSGGSESTTILGTRLPHSLAHGIATAADLDAHLRESAREQRATGLVVLCESLDTGSVEVTTTQIVEVDVRSFSGHVFTLETVEGWFLAGQVTALLAKNCRCTVIYDDAGTGSYGDDLHLTDDTSSSDAGAGTSVDAGSSSAEEGAGASTSAEPSTAAPTAGELLDQAVTTWVAEGAPSVTGDALSTLQDAVDAAPPAPEALSRGLGVDDETAKAFKAMGEGDTYRIGQYLGNGLEGFTNQSADVASGWAAGQGDNAVVLELQEGFGHALDVAEHVALGQADEGEYIVGGNVPVAGTFTDDNGALHVLLGDAEHPSAYLIDNVTYGPGEGGMSYGGNIPWNEALPDHATSVNDITSWMTDKWGTMSDGSTRAISFDKLSEDGARIVAKEVDRQFTEHPQIAERIVSVETHRGSNGIGLANSGAKSISFSQDWFGRTAEEIAAKAESQASAGWWATGNVEGTIAHEVGHHVGYLAETLNYLDISGTSTQTIEGLDWFGARPTMAYGQDKAYGKELGKIIRSSTDARGLSSVTPNMLSRYSTTNWRELVAESWSEYTTSPNPRPLAEAIGKQLEEYMARLPALPTTLP